MHYLVVPPGSSPIAESWVRQINVGWTVFSREIMRMSANPTTWYEHIVAMIVNICRYIFNNVYIFLFMLFVSVILAVAHKSKTVKKTLRQLVRSAN